MTLYISIHVPREGDDKSNFDFLKNFLYFNPRPP